LAVLLVLLIIDQSVASTDTCVSNPRNDISSDAVKIFNGCYKDNTPDNVPYYMAQQVNTWFSLDLYLQYLLLILFVIPYIAFSEDTDGERETTMESSARANRARLSTVFLMFRVDLAYSMNFWLKTTIKQERPCVCEFEGMPFTAYVLGSENGIWGMPSGDTTAASVIGFAMIESLNPLLGFVLMALVGAARVLVGVHSIGQVLAAVGVGLAIHFYGTRTPNYFRVLDVLLNLIAGLVVFFVTKHDHPDYDLTFSVYFLNGFIWQIFAFIMMFVMYDIKFIKSIIRKAPAQMDIPDFLYYLPLNQPVTTLNPQNMHEGKWMLFWVAMLFLSLGGLQILAPHLNSILKT